jgi:hypothetical protein
VFLGRERLELLWLGSDVLDVLVVRVGGDAVDERQELVHRIVEQPGVDALVGGSGNGESSQKTFTMRLT